MKSVLAPIVRSWERRRPVGTKNYAAFGRDARAPNISE
jgi:hypothetical protein